MNRILEDIRVVDLTHVWFGPFCTMILADLGAEVIKVEPPWGELIRFRPPLYGDAGPNFLYLNLNKKGMTLNLKNEKGLKVFKELVKVSDVVVENFSPGTIDRMGLGYDILKEVNPRLIFVSLSGFGQNGPYSHRPSFAPIAEALSGHSRLTGDVFDPGGPPLPIAEAYGDLGPALWAALSIISAIRFRDKTGKGQKIDVAQVDCMISLAPSIVTYTLTGKMPWEINKMYKLGLGGIFKAQDGYVRIASTMGAQMDRLTKLIDVTEADEKALKAWVESKTVKEVVDTLIGADIPVAPILSPKETVEDPHVLARNMIVEVDHPKAGRMKVPNFPVKFSESPGEILGPAPLLGQHNEDILSNLLGYSKEEIESLRKERVVT